ncbi:MAG TPA: HEAT repeat domain-containing protein [Solirubrobacteraceae bacterium]|nr:HEAT repeat domain-containing protein [Solirubrobacteraceae bacterium]
MLYVLRFAEPLQCKRRAELLAAAERAGLLDRLQRSLRTPGPMRRGVAALTLAALRVPGGELWVSPLIADPDPDVRLAAIAALSDWSTPAAASALIDALERFDLPPERIVEKLGALWAAPTVHARLRQTMGRDCAADQSPQRRQNRLQLIRALELSGLDEAEPDLLELIESGDPEERISAARALGAVGSRRSVPRLIAALESDSWPLRAQAARALGRLTAVEAMPQLAAHLSDRAWWVRKQAGRALVALGPAGGFELLEAALAHDDRFARDRAAEELRLAMVSHHAPASPFARGRWPMQMPLEELAG